ncbi:MAG TPA: flagellar type III secretion system pore protein FliP [Balneolales bacterium]|nr:flagellar type III secretion system pore protein FliP [Balneolales bacterium]
MLPDQDQKYGYVRILLMVIFLTLILISTGHAQSTSTSSASGSIPQINLSIKSPKNGKDFSVAIQTLIILTILTFGPAFITMMTSFTRIIVVFFFLRMGLGTQQSPPNQVLLGLALFITIFIMAPTYKKIDSTAIQPYLNNKITQMDALDEAAIPLKEFMIKQTRQKDLLLFMDLAKVKTVNNVRELPLYIVVPSFIISELRIAFKIGFLLYLPFMVIDLVVTSVLLSMGIMFLPPVLVSLPFKILVFVLTDGWYLLVGSLVRSFH